MKLTIEQFEEYRRLINLLGKLNKWHLRTVYMNGMVESIEIYGGKINK